MYAIRTRGQEAKLGKTVFTWSGSQRACKRCFAAVEASPHRELFYPFPAAPTPVPAPAQPEEVHEAKAPQLDDVKDFPAGKGMEYSSEITAKLLQAGMDINIVAKCVKDYQKKFLHIYKESPQMAEAFTCKDSSKGPRR